MPQAARTNLIRLYSSSDFWTTLRYGFFRITRSTAQRPGRRVVAVPGRGRAVADLRCHARRQLRAWLVFHAGRLHRLQPGGALWRRAGLLARAGAVGARHGCDRRAGRGGRAAADLPCARAVPTARDLRAGAGDQGRGAVAVGARGLARTPRAGAVRCGRHPGPALSQLRFAVDRRRPAGAGRAVAAAQAHPLGHAGARGDAGPRNGRCARREPGLAVHQRVRTRRDARGLGRRAATAARAGFAQPRSIDHWRRFRRRRGRRHGLDPGGLCRRAADRRDQGDVRRAGHGPGFWCRFQFFQAHAGGRISGDGCRAGVAALGLDGAAAGAQPKQRGDRAAASPCEPAVAGRCRTGGCRLAAAAAGHDRQPLCHGARDRLADRRVVRRQPALHHGAGGHALFRPCCLLRAGGLRRRAADAEGGLADGGRAGGRTAGRWLGRSGVRMVLRSFVGRLPGNAHARVRADRLVGHLPVGRTHRWQQWSDWRLAGSLAGRQA